MTSSTFQTEIEKAVSLLLNMARELTYSKISDNYKFILTEIHQSDENFHVQRHVRKRENDKKVPVTLSELMLTLKSLYGNLYDINLHIYKATKDITIIDFRYYPKSSLEPNHQLDTAQNPPMLHCNVAQPPWLTDKNEKFDINWEHKQWLINWKLFWARRKLKR